MKAVSEQILDASHKVANKELGFHFCELGNKVAQLEEENKELREFVRLVQVEWTVLESAESEGFVRVEYPTAVHIKLKALEAGGEDATQ